MDVLCALLRTAAGWDGTGQRACPPDDDYSILTPTQTAPLFLSLFSLCSAVTVTRQTMPSAIRRNKKSSHIRPLF
jgi:hypothetical protein